jgi:hypothetical protein
MTYEIDLRRYQTVSNPGAYDKDSTQADLGMRIISMSKEGNGPYDFSLYGPMIENPDAQLNGLSSRNKFDMIALAKECRDAWKSTVVDHQLRSEIEGKPQFLHPFQEKWDFQQEGRILDDIIPSLARAGENLFTSIFERECDDDLKEIGDTLRKLMASDSRYLVITSNSLFQPWGMLYTHPDQLGRLKQDGSNAVKEGFWGYRHLVQQTPKRFRHGNALRADGSGTVPTSVNFDERLAVAFQLPVIDEHIEFLCRLGATRRTKKSELAAVFEKQNRSKLESIVYFYCHGHGADNGTGTNLPYLELTDGSVSSFDFQRWADGEELPTSPLIFINACQGGQMTTVFYESFAVELLKEGAAGLIGAQIDVPIVFAVEYAKEIFERFFERSNNQKVRLGPIMREVNKKLFDCNRNPLGLVYSLYRGADCFVDWSTMQTTDAAHFRTPDAFTY